MKLTDTQIRNKYRNYQEYELKGRLENQKIIGTYIYRQNTPEDSCGQDETGRVSPWP